MADAPSGSSSGSAMPKGIGSLAKKRSDVTRQGTQKLKFTPTLPVRRKKDEVKPESSASTDPEPANASTRSRGRGRGSTDTARGRGRGRGGSLLAAEMTASGPFALGPALGSNQASRSVTRADLTPAVPTPSRTSTTLGGNPSQAAAPTLKGSDQGKAKVKEEEEMYSDPDEGVDIIDMKQIKDMDYMAPEPLPEERKYEKVKNKSESGAIDFKNALDLSESEDEEEVDDLIEDFAVKNDLDADAAYREDRLYFFQFPAPFPKFTKANPGHSMIGSAQPEIEAEPVNSLTKKVSFAPDTKPAVTPSSSRPSTAPPEHATEELVDGIIGQLEVYRSGAVKIRLVNDILLDVHTGTQPTFLQQAVHLDVDGNSLTVLGEIKKQFIVSPDIDSLLEATELKQQSSGPFDITGADQLLVMDTT